MNAVHRQPSSEQPYDVAVVGAGLGGLAAATLLAREGKKVCLFEKSKTSGGRAQTQDQEGYLFNLGPHALYRKGHAERVLKQLGIPYSGKSPNPAGGLALHNDEEHLLPTGFFSLLTTTLFQGAERWEAARLLLSLSTLNPKKLDGITVSRWLDQHVKAPKNKHLFRGFFRLSTYINAPDAQCMGSAVRQLQHAGRHNVTYLDGGWQTLVDGLLDAAIASGVSIFEDCRVEALKLSNTQITGVQLADGRLFPCQHAILAIPPQNVKKLLPEGASPTLVRKLERCTPVHAATLDLALRTLPDPQHLFALGLEEPFYMSAHSPYAKLTPGHGHLLQIAKYLPSKQAQPTERQELEAVLERVQPGWRDALITSRFMPKLIVVQDFPKAEEGGLNGRTPVQVPDIQGLYLVGDWVGAKGQLADTSFASASTASQLISQTYSFQKTSQSV